MVSLKRGQQREESVPRDGKRGTNSKGRGEWNRDRHDEEVVEEGDIGFG